MKKNKGFTLIELLAVITIMGILMIVAIGSVNRIIENARRDTFASTAKEYIKTVRQEVLADNISCEQVAGKEDSMVTASGTKDGTYYFVIDTQNDQGTKDLMQTGGKSPFGGSELVGYVKWVKETSGNMITKETYTIMVTDTGKHGLIEEVEEEDLKRVNITTDTSSCGAESTYCLEAGKARTKPNEDGVFKCKLN